MKLGVLFSGGKDSTYALAKAMETDDVACLITLVSENKESYMFHTPAIGLTMLQAQAMNLPIIQANTSGEKEEELTDLKIAIEQAMEQYAIEGIVTGAVESVYQASRIENICQELGLWCFNPLWKKDQQELLEELLANGFDVMITGVFAQALEEDMIGRKLDERLISDLLKLRDKHGISITGEGGEIETLVLDAPMFKKRLAIQECETKWDSNSGILEIALAGLEEK